MRQLPPELLAAVLELLPDRRDLKRLCEVSREFHRFVTPMLYKSITVQAQSEQFLENIDISPFMLTGYNSENRIQFVEAISFTSQFRHRLSNRCLHNRLEYDSDEDDWQSEGSNEDANEHSDLPQLANDILPLLESIRDGALRSFTWELGTCVPKRILGPSGYLTRKQNLIESIRLVTDGLCLCHDMNQCPLDLSGFKNLKKLSWKGLQSPPDFRTLSRALSQNSTRLVELELDMIWWGRELTLLRSNEDDSEDFFGEVVRELSTSSTLPTFPALQALSLSAISLKWAKSIPTTFDFSSLRSLKLRFCPRLGDLLDHIVRSNQRIVLTSLEIQSDINNDSSDQLVGFLSAFVGLEEFFLYTESDELGLDIWRCLITHKATLRTFVHHQRFIDLNPDNSTFEEECDLPTVSYFPREIAELVEESDNPLNDLDLECFGFCCLPHDLKFILSRLTRKPSLQVLHIRQSGCDLEYFPSWGFRQFGRQISRRYESPNPANPEDSDASSQDGELVDLTEGLHDFAQWAFGPDGLPSLRIIVFGDFAYGGRYPWNNAYLCRNSDAAQAGGEAGSELHFRHLDDSDRLLWALVDEYSNVLEACPTELLFND